MSMPGRKRDRVLFLFALAILLLPLLFLKVPLKIQSNMMSLLPKENEQIIKQKAFDHLSEVTSRKIIILFGTSTKEQAYKISKFFYNSLEKSPFIETIELNFKARSNEKLIEIYRPYRNQLLTPQFASFLLNNQGDVIQKNAIRDLYTPVSDNIIPDIVHDPFLLLSHFVKELPFFKSALFPYQNILMAQNDGRYYAFSTITVKENVPFSVTELSEVMSNINNAKNYTKKEFRDVEIVMSGVPIHSYEASQSSIKEINIISFISIMGILAMIYANFRSLRPFYFALFSIGTGLFAGIIITNFIFGEVHLLTIVFGASLIGVCEDYSMHYFSEYFNKSWDKENPTGEKILNHIYPGLLNGLLTTLIGYAALIFTPFPGLKQIACFSSVGLIISFVTVILFFPKFYRPKELIYKSPLLNFSRKFLYSFRRIMADKNVYPILFVLIALSMVGFTRLKFNDDIKLLYSSPKKIINQEKEVRKILQQNIAVQFFLIKAKTPQELLEKEEKLTYELRKLVIDKELESFQSLSQIVPSIAKQKRNLEMVKYNLFQPYLKKQAQELGLTQSQISEIEKELKKEPKYLEINDVLKNQILNGKILWIGKVNGKYGGVILLNGIMNPKSLENLVDEDQGIYLLNKVEDVSKTFEKYRQISLFLLILVYLGILAILSYRYQLLRSIVISIPPLLSATCTIAVIALLGHEVNLFNILALFLVIGIGVDYSIFYEETNRNKAMNNNVTSLAVLLSSVTTLLSFGLLAFSRFPFLQSFGVTVLLGIIFSYLLSPLVTLKKFR